MPSEAVVLRWCDPCWIESELKVASVHTYTGGFANGEVRPSLHVIEVCADHLSMIVELDELLRQCAPLSIAVPGAPGKSHHGKPDPKEVTRRQQAAAAGEYLTARDNCPVCGIEYALSQVAGHIWMAHLGRPQGRPRQPVQCPDCVYYNELGAAMGQHRVRVHDYNAVAEALALYQQRLEDEAAVEPVLDEIEKAAAVAPRRRGKAAAAS